MSNENEKLPEEGVVTIFPTLPGDFPVLLSLDTKLNTNEFLEASSSVVILIGKFGKVFSPVIHDIEGNIKKIRAKYEENTEAYEFIEDMILEGKNNEQLVVVDALQWLRRALHFVSTFFSLIIEDTDKGNCSADLGRFIKSAYKETLERYHGWLGVQLFNILSRFVPTRRQLLYTFALETHNEQQVIHDLRKFTDKMSNCVQRLSHFYQQNELETFERV